MSNKKSNSLVVWREFETRRVAKSKPIKTKIGFDFTGVPNASLYALAARMLTIDLQRSWRAAVDDDESFKSLLEKENGSVISVADWLKKKPARDTSTSKLKKFIKACKEIDLPDSKIIELAVEKGYDRQLVESLL